MLTNTKIKYKVILIVLLFFGLFIATNLLVQNQFLKKDYQALERENAHKDMERCVSAFKKEISHLDTLTNDWSAWDDTYAIVTPGVEQVTIDEYIESNLTEDTFTSGKLNLIYIVDASGKVVFGKLYDANWQKKSAIEEFPQEAFDAQHILLGHSAINSSISGVIKTQIGHLLISSRPIITSERKGPIHGTLMMGRLITEAFIKNLAEQTRVAFIASPIDIHPATPAAGSHLVGTQMAHASQQTDSVRVSVLNSDYLKASYTFTDIYNRPTLRFDAKIDREISKRGNDLIAFATFSLVLSGFLILTLIILFLQKTILHPISDLTRRAALIYSKKDLSVHFETDRGDEIGRLAQEFENARCWIKDTNNNLEKLVDERTKALTLKSEEQQVLIQVGQAISEETDLTALLEIIVVNAMVIANADGGTLYLYNSEKDQLEFQIMRNTSKNIVLGGTSGGKIDLPAVPLQAGGKSNMRNILAYTALTGKTVKIDNVYDGHDDFTLNEIKAYDKNHDYQTQAILVVPLRDHEDRSIGVLQLLNAKDFYTQKFVPFNENAVSLVKTLANQAAIALNNSILMNNYIELFNSFIKSIAIAIDEKSPFTGGHIKRVVALTDLIVEKINTDTKGPFKAITFTQDQKNELLLAAWMHDVGKIATPDVVVDKSSRLFGAFDRINLLETRFQLIRNQGVIQYLKSIIRLMHHNGYTKEKARYVSSLLKKNNRRIQNDFFFLKECNIAEFLEKQDIERIHQISRKTYAAGKHQHPYLDDDECYNLSIQKGTLTQEERGLIEDHARVTKKILNQLPFPRSLANIPEYAGDHHEKLDGSGYPNGKSGHELPLQTRILTFADIFEALTAKDRPYRQKPKQLSRVIKILGLMVKDNHLDPDILDLFLNSDIVEIYSKSHLLPEQIDIEKKL